MIFISDIRQYLFISRLKILESANCVQFGGRNVARNVITLITYMNCILFVFIIEQVQFLEITRCVCFDVTNNLPSLYVLRRS